MDLDKQSLTLKMTDNLPMLRAKLGFTQEDLANKIGVSRSTVVNIETKKRDMTWNTFLALMYVFSKDDETRKILNVLDITTGDIDK